MGGVFVLDKHNKIVAMAKEKAARREAEVLEVISEMVANGEKVTFYKVQKVTGAARSYLYGNENIRKLIEEAREASN